MLNAPSLIIFFLLGRIAIGTILVWNILGYIPVAAQLPRCEAPDARIRLDHVSIAVHNLPALVDRFMSEFGFSFKSGRKHANGLINQHIKFEDGSGLELITVREPGDEIAHQYADLIEQEGGGAYLALAGRSIEEFYKIVFAIEPDLKVTRSPAFDIAAFPIDHALHSVFFVDVHKRIPDRIEYLTHTSGAIGLDAVWISVKDSDRFARFLRALGARDCGISRHSGNLFGYGFGVSGGMIYVVDTSLRQVDTGVAPVVLITLAARVDAEPRNITLEEAGGLQIEIRPHSE